MTTYKVKLVSQGNAIILIIFLLILLFVTRGAFLPKTMSTASTVTMVVLSCAITYYSWQKFVTGRTEWTVDLDGITITWTKKFPWTATEDYNFAWIDIKNISRGPDPHYYNLKIELESGDTETFIHDTLTTGDDFEALKKELFQKMADKKA